MSERYPSYYRSNFPNNIDEFEYMNDVTGELYIAVTTYNNYIRNGSFTAAMQLIEANPDLKNCIFNADKHNKLLDAVMSIETFFYEDVEEYIANVVKDRGQWDSTVTDYVKYNVVSDDTNMCYLAIQDVLDAKAELTDTNYWKPITLKGDKGDKGDTGKSFNPRGKYVDGDDYYALDVVAYNDKLYVAFVDNSNVLPTDTNCWIVISDVEFPTNDFITNITSDGTNITYTRGDGSTETISANTTLTFKDVIVGVDLWTEDNIYGELGYNYRADIACEGVTEDYFADVIFNVSDSTSGNYAPNNVTESGVVSIYAKEIPTDTITIPLIKCEKVVKV